MIPDMINGSFEVLGGILGWLNVRQLIKDKTVKGVYWPVQLFFFVWGVWNLYYYPSLGQWYSFFGGICIVTGNLAWVVFAIYYLKFAKDRR